MKRVTQKNKEISRRGVALILVLGIILILGVMLGSFAFLANVTLSSTRHFSAQVTASGLANSGYNFMVGAIQDFFTMSIEELVEARFEAQSQEAQTLYEEEKKAVDQHNKPLQDEIDQYQGWIDYYQGEINWYQGKIRDYQDKIDNLDPDHDKYEERKNHWQNKINNAQGEINWREGKIRDYRDHINNLEGQKKDYPESPEVNKNEKITSDEFNRLSAALTMFLNGKPFSFQDFYFIRPDVRTALDRVMFGENSDGTYGEGKQSWASKYGFMKGANPDEVANYKYDVDLDGVNNYIFSNDLQQEYAKSLLGYSTVSAKDFTNSHVNDEQKDADWHYVQNEYGDVIGRFAVMARDQASLINLKSAIGREGVDELLDQSSGGLTEEEEELASMELNNVLSENADPTDMENLLGLLQVDEQDTAGSFTTGSTNNSKKLDLNMASPEDFFLYLREDEGNTSTSLNGEAKEALARANTKIAANLRDFVDHNNYPYGMTKFNWTERQRLEFSPWNNLRENDIYFGMEGVRISEVMVQPEQAFRFNNSASASASDQVLKVRFQRDDAKVQVDGQDTYYYKTKNSSLQVSPKLFEVQRDASEKGTNTSNFNALNGADMSVTLSDTVEIANPGGAYQVWLKAKITASNTTASSGSDWSDFKSEVESGGGDVSDKVTNPDLVVKWNSDTSGGNIDSLSLVMYISSDINDKLMEEPPFVFQAGVTSLAALKNELTSKDSLALVTGDGVVIKSHSESNLTKIANTNMRFQGNPNAQVDWDGANDRLNEASTIYGDRGSSWEYPFGSRVLEIALFDAEAGRAEIVTSIGSGSGGEGSGKGGGEDITPEGQKNAMYRDGDDDDDNDNSSEEGEGQEDGEGQEEAEEGKSLPSEAEDVDISRSSTPRDELIGVFYCVNTNGFAEDDHVSGDNSMWFFSVGTPPWLEYEDLPEWLQSRVMDPSGGVSPLKSAALAGDDPEYLNNLCVFPREKCKLKFRFRMVDLGDSRFNGGDKPNYKVGVNGIKIGGTEYNSSSDLSSLSEDLAIVGRPSWDEGDQVEVAISELLLTQQLYTTSLKQPAEIGNASSGQMPVTYNYIDAASASQKILKKISGSSAAVPEQDLTKLLYYRNQRLENRVANELHACEYIELFNGTASNVDLKNWILKVEQYKKSGGEYNLLWPAQPDLIYDATPDVEMYVGPETDMKARPQYILIEGGALPANGKKDQEVGVGADSENAHKMPYSILTNFLNDDGKSFLPAIFPNTETVALGDMKLAFGNTDESDGIEAGGNRFNVNLGTAWNMTVEEESFLRGSSVPASFTVGSPLEDRGMDQSNSRIPLRLRDDADLIVITLFQPKNTDKALISEMLDSDGYKVYEDGTENQKYGEEEVDHSFGLVSDFEYVSSVPTGTTSPDEFQGAYAVVDRAVLHREVINEIYEANNPGKTGTDWWGNKSVFLNTFYTDPLLLRKGIPGSMSETTPFNEELDEGKGFPLWNDGERVGEEVDNGKLAEKAAKYWSPHQRVFKAKPGPLGWSGNFVMISSASPGQPDYPFPEGDDAIDVDAAKASVTMNIPTHPMVETRDERAHKRTMYGEDPLYALKHTGFGQNNHNIISYNAVSESGAFIKNAPLSSVAELCDVPAPSIEDDMLGDPLKPDSLINSFVDGLEGGGQYFTIHQKQKIFSGTSASATVLTMGDTTNLNLADRVTGSQYSGANPVIFAPSTGAKSKTNWALRFNFDCTKAKPDFQPGKYKVFITGLNPRYDANEDGSLDDGESWDVIKSITLVSDGTVDLTKKAQGEITEDDAEQLRRMGVGTLSGPNGTAIKNIMIEEFDEEEGEKVSVPIASDKMVQILPSNAMEFFSIQNSFEVNIMMDGSSDTLQNGPYAVGDLGDMVEEVMVSPSFMQIGIHLVPQESIGKVNINTAPVHVMLRIPGFRDAVAEDGELDDPIQKTAANEVVDDILNAIAQGKDFTDAGDLLTYTNEDGPRKDGRLFPVNGRDKGFVEGEIDPEADLDSLDYGDVLVNEKMARAKLKVYRKALPHIQFAGNSFEIVALGQALKKDGDDFKATATHKVSVTVDLKNLMSEIAFKYVADPWNVGTRVFDGEERDANVEALQDLVGEGGTVQPLTLGGDEVRAYLITSGIFTQSQSVLTDVDFFTRLMIQIKAMMSLSFIVTVEEIKNDWEGVVAKIKGAEQSFRAFLDAAVPTTPEETNPLDPLGGGA